MALILLGMGEYVSKLQGTIGMISASIQNTWNILKLLLLLKTIYKERKNANTAGKNHTCTKKQAMQWMVPDSTPKVKANISDKIKKAVGILQAVGQSY